MTDYSQTPSAIRDRLDKARLISNLAWTLGFLPEQILGVVPDHNPVGLTEEQWQALARRATGKPASEETRRLTYCHFAWREACAASEPGHPDSRRVIRPFDDIVADLTARRPRGRRNHR